MITVIKKQTKQRHQNAYVPKRGTVSVILPETEERELEPKPMAFKTHNGKVGYWDANEGEWNIVKRNPIDHFDSNFDNGFVPANCMNEAENILGKIWEAIEKAHSNNHKQAHLREITKFKVPNILEYVA